MAETNLLTSGNVAAPTYPTFQPIQQPNMLAQMGDATNLARGMQALQSQQFDLGKQRALFVQDRLGSLVTKPDLQFSDVTDMVGDMVRNNIIPPSEAPQILQHVPQDPAQLRASIKQSYTAGLDHVNRMGYTYGNQTTYDNNAGRQYGVTKQDQPGQPQFAGGTFQPKLPDPTELQPGPPVRDPNTGAVSQPRLPADMVMGIARGTHKYGFGPNGQMTIQPVGGSASAPQATVGVPGVPAGAVEAAGVTARAGAEQGASIEAAAANAPTRRAMLNNLEDDLKKFDTGPGAGVELAAKRAYNYGAEKLGIPKYDEAGVAAHENFNKQSSQLIQQQFSALGGTGTDKQLGASISSNPNDTLSKMGNRQIVQLLNGNEDAIAAKNTAWQQWKQKNGPDSNAQFQEDWNKTFSPRAFQWVHMTPAERKDMVANMKPGERAQVAKALQQAEDRGWIKPGQ